AKDERRALNRPDAPFKGMVTFKIQGQEVQREIQTKDINVDGGYFIADTCPTIGDPVTLFLEWPPAAEQPGLTLDVAGTVLRMDQLSEKECGFAVKFDERPHFVRV
ncbi:PilZ domain-containing protein, partial [Acidobacteria bacterium AH-259-D05]|nr:PilZ domain-containing protein [Acidobacteria bacterium AH-259-D05]